jgi:hypothetical protein
MSREIDFPAGLVADRESHIHLPYNYLASAQPDDYQTVFSFTRSEV